MNVLFLTLCDFQSISERWIYTDLMSEFVSHGHRVTIVSPRERRYGENTCLHDYGTYRVLKPRVGNMQKTSMIERGISTILFEYQVLLAVKAHLRDRFDLVLYSTPPITFAKVINFIKKRDGASTYLMLKDIFPQNAVDLGVLRKGSIPYRLFRKKEKQLYRLSDFIGCMSQANARYLLHNNPEIPEAAVEICPNSITPVDLRNPDREAIRSRYGLPSQSVLFIWGGNFGKPQGMDYVIEVLEENRDKPDRYFVMCGTGTEFPKLRDYIEEKKPQNVALIAGLPKERYDELVSACDVGLLFLDNRFTIPNFPSRMLSYMEYCLPVLAATDRNTDIGRVIEDAGYGWWCESSNPVDFTQIVEHICSHRDELLCMGRRARQYLEDNFTSRHSYEIIMRHFCTH